MDRKLIQNNEDCELAFGLNRMMLTLLGIWPNAYKNDYFKNLRIPFMLLWLFVGFFLPQLYALIKVYPDLTLIIDNAIVTSGIALAIVKLFLIWHHRNVFEPLIHWMTVDWSCQKSSWERDMMLKQARRGRLFTMSGFAVMISSISCFAFSPFFGIDLRIVNNITDRHEHRYFPIQTYYPYDFTVSPSFELTYVSQLISLGFAGASFSAADNFFGVLVFHAAGQCEILAGKLTRLFDPANRDGKVSIKEKLCRTVNKHVYLVQFVVAIEKSFNILVLFHVLGLSVPMCCVGFGVVNSFDNENSSLPFIQIVMLSVGMVNTMLHMLVYCTATEILTSNSESFMQATYNSKWYLFPAKQSRDVIILMMRSQYPLRLTVGKFIYLSLDLYARILKTAAGFISMLLAVR